MKHILTILSIFTSAGSLFSQATDSFYIKPDYTLTIMNNHMVDPTHYEFDIYMRHTNRNETVMLYGSCQYGIKINSAYLGGGTMTCAIISTDLSDTVKPPSIHYYTNFPIGPVIFMSANLPTTNSETDTVKWIAPGTLIGRVRLTNSIPWNTAENINLRHSDFSSPRTKITVYTDSDNVRLRDITDTIHHFDPIPTVTDPTYSSSIPTEFTFSQNYPNPFNPTTKIEYSLPVDGRVSMKVFDITGREMMNLVNDVKPAGYYSVDFNGNNLASGIYFYRMEVFADGVMKYQVTRRMVLVK